MVGPLVKNWTINHYYQYWPYLNFFFFHKNSRKSVGGKNSKELRCRSWNFFSKWGYIDSQIITHAPRATNNLLIKVVVSAQCLHILLYKLTLGKHLWLRLFTLFMLTTTIQTLISFTCLSPKWQVALGQWEISELCTLYLAFFWQFLELQSFRLPPKRMFFWDTFFRKAKLTTLGYGSEFGWVMLRRIFLSVAMCYIQTSNRNKLEEVIV